MTLITRKYVLLLAACLGCLSISAWANSKPNIIIMLADDAGYSDFACYGGSHIRTPRIDQLAKEGIHFTDFYAPAPNCSPSRAGMLTGRIPSRVGIYSYINHGSPMHLPAKELTIAEIVKEQGYQTCISGKWHLNGNIAGKDQPSPSEHGFDHWFCTDNNASPSHKDPVNFYRNGKPVGKVEGYSCQVVVDEAIGWLDKRDKDRPFFTYIAFHEPHTPIASPPELMQKYEGTKKQKAYYANVENMDLAVGRMLDYLDKKGLRDSTMVIFSSDNGGTNPSSNVPLRGRKSNVWDGGIREPGIIRWPKHIKAGSTHTEPAGLLDILPTIAETTGASLPENHTFDGTSLLPAFNGQSLKREQPLFWLFYRVSPSVAMREDDWMLIGYLEEPGYTFTHPYTARDTPFIKNSTIERFELFNLKKDISQKVDVSSEHPERLDKMIKKMRALHKDVVSDGPVWTFDK